MGTAQCTTEAPTFDCPVEFPHSRFRKYVKFCCNVTCALAEAKLGAVSENREDGVVVSPERPHPVCEPGKLFEMPGTGGWGLGVTGCINCRGNFFAPNEQ